VGRLAVIVAGALLILVPCALMMLLNAFRSPVDCSTNGPLSGPTDFYTKCLTTYWTQVNYQQKLWNSSLIAGVVAVAAVLISLLHAIGAGRVKGRLWIVALFLLGYMSRRQEAPGLSALRLRQKDRALQHQARRRHHPHRHPERLRQLPARLGVGHVPQCRAGGRGAGRREPLADPVEGRLPDRPADPVRAVIFFFIWTWNEFFIPLVILIDNNTRAIPMALASLQGDRLMDAPTTNAGSLISSSFEGTSSSRSTEQPATAPVMRPWHAHRPAADSEEADGRTGSLFGRIQPRCGPDESCPDGMPA
jgi:raffinose/stachyose/melibiose transport system permease protein